MCVLFSFGTVDWPSMMMMVELVCVSISPMARRASSWRARARVPSIAQQQQQQRCKQRAAVKWPTEDKTGFFLTLSRCLLFSVALFIFCLCRINRLLIGRFAVSCRTIHKCICKRIILLCFFSSQFFFHSICLFGQRVVAPTTATTSAHGWIFARCTTNRSSLARPVEPNAPALSVCVCCACLSRFNRRVFFMCCIPKRWTSYSFLWQQFFLLSTMLFFSFRLIFSFSSHCRQQNDVRLGLGRFQQNTSSWKISPRPSSAYPVLLVSFNSARALFHLPIYFSASHRDRGPSISVDSELATE